MEPNSRSKPAALYLVQLGAGNAASLARHASVRVLAQTTVQGRVQDADSDTRADPQVQKAIELMRSQLHRRWTVTSLARAVGLSRAAFARRFHGSAGLSPHRYLTALRMERAAELLKQREQGLSRVAVEVGYDSEFAFNRAFKRHHGVAPGSYRRAAQLTRAPVFRAAA